MAKMICPDCGIEMTHHATKVILPRTEAEAALFDEELEGVALEAHSCPGCGKGASSVAEPS
jgi:ribosomal protein S27AE